MPPRIPGVSYARVRATHNWTDERRQAQRERINKVREETAAKRAAGLLPAKPRPPVRDLEKQQRRELAKEQTARFLTAKAAREKEADQIELARREMRKLGPLTLDDQIAIASRNARSSDPLIALPWARHLKNLQSGYDQEVTLKRLSEPDVVLKLSEMMTACGQRITDQAYTVSFRGGRIRETHTGRIVESVVSPGPREAIDVSKLPKFEDYLAGITQPADSGVDAPDTGKSTDAEFIDADSEPVGDDGIGHDADGEPVFELSGTPGDLRAAAGKEPPADPGVGGAVKEDRGARMIPSAAWVEDEGLEDL